MITPYPITFGKSFYIFWSIAVLWELYDGGLLGVAFTFMAMLIIVSHEHAHALQCIKNGNTILGIHFNWMGGAVIADIDKTEHKIDFYKAGLIDNGAYAIGLTEIVCAIWFIHNYLHPSGINFAPNPFLSLLNSIAFFSVILFICNLVPLSYHSKKHDMIITTDGWATYKLITRE